MHEQYPNLFSPLKVRHLTFRNRIFCAPVGMIGSTPAGAPSPAMITYYGEKARGGAALVTVGDTPVDLRYGASEMPQYMKFDIINMPAFQELSQEIHDGGALASFELNHPGRSGGKMANLNHEDAIGPVEYVKSNGEVIKAATKEQLEYTAGKFAEAAMFVKTAGFDMVTVHAGHGWFLSQFLSPALNTRTDEFGGSMENRARFPLMVLKAIREAVGERFVIEVRINGSDTLDDGFTPEMCIDFLERAKPYIDLAHISAGIVSNMHKEIITHVHSYLPHGANTKYAAQVKKAIPDLPIITVGAISDPAYAEKLIADGVADVVSMARAAIADPHFANKAKYGMSEDIRPCLRCNNCIGEIQDFFRFGCDVNPVTGHELRLRNSEKAPAFFAKVLVAGGGVAGMQCAMTAAERGHKVFLIEKEDRLGGTLNYTDHDQHYKEDLWKFKEYMIRQVKKANVEIRLNTELSEDLIKELKPDVLVAAFGALPAVPPIVGLKDCRYATALDAYNHPEDLGDHIVIIGGGLTGTELGIYLSDTHKDVVVLEAADDFAKDVNEYHYMAVHDEVPLHPALSIITGAKVTECADGAVTYVKDGETVTLKADDIVLAVGMRGRKDEAEKYRDMVRDFYIIGDCDKAGRVRTAVWSGYHTGRIIGNI